MPKKKVNMFTAQRGSGGKTRWFPRHVHPVRVGEYECAVQISRSCPNMLYRLHWDGTGFIVPCPMIVNGWRGQTLAAHRLTSIT